MAPFFGASTVIWANTIAVVLIALSVGLQARRRAGRSPAVRARPVRRGAAGLRAARGRAVHRAPVPVAERAGVRRAVGGGVLRVAVRDAGAGGGAAAAAGGGVAVGDAAAAWPRWPRRARSPGGCTRSRRSARWWACSSWRCGRSRRSGRSGRSSCSRSCRRRSRRSGWGLARCCVPGALVVALLLPVGTTKPAQNGRVIFETETPYQYARVIELPNGERRLELNEGQAIHSLLRPGTVLTGGYWDGFLVLPFATGRGAPRRIAALGTAGGTVPRAYASLLPVDERRRGGHRPGAVQDRAALLRPAAAAAAARDRAGRAAVPARLRGSATTRSSSTPTGSRTSRST